MWINNKVERIFNVMSDDKLAKEAKSLAGLGKGDHGDRVPVDVAMPPDVCLRFDFKH